MSLALFKHLSRRNNTRKINLNKRFHVASRHHTTNPTPKGFQSTELPSGIKVVTYETETPYCNVSLYTKAGSRYENFLTRGSAQFLKALAHANTHDTLAIDLNRRIGALGGLYHSTATREYVGYHTQFLNDKMSFDIATSTLEDAVQPAVLEYEVDKVRSLVEGETRKLTPKEVAFEMSHMESFRTSGLGQPLYVNGYDLNRIVPQHIVEHAKNFYLPGERMLIVGIGVKHNDLVNGFEKLASRVVKDPSEFVGYKLELDEFIPLPDVPATSQNSEFIEGGNAYNPESYNNHVVVSFPGASVKDSEYTAAHILSELISIQNESLIRGFSTNIGYTDTGLFTVYAESDRYKISNTQMRDVILESIKKATKPTKQAFEQAKGRVKASILSSFENRQKFSDEVALRAFAGAKLETPSEIVKSVDQITEAQVAAFAKKMTSKKPTIVSLGDRAQ